MDVAFFVVSNLLLLFEIKREKKEQDYQMKKKTMFSTLPINKLIFPDRNSLLNGLVQFS